MTKREKMRERENRFRAEQAARGVHVTHCLSESGQDQIADKVCPCDSHRAKRSKKRKKDGK